MLGVMMSQHDRTPSGLKKKSNSTDDLRPGILPGLFSQQLRYPETPKPLAIPHNAYNGSLLNPPDPSSLPPIQTPVPFETVLTHVSAPFHAPYTGRTFPHSSPEGSAGFTLPPLALSPPKSASFTSQSELSQPETWTDDPTLQSLQRENADLVSAYSQAQARMAELDTALQASSTEIAKLFKDRQKLEAKIDILEAEVGELQNSTEQSQYHSTAKDAQYSQILEFSTRLQTQAVSDAQQQRVDNERWEREKQNMLQTITSLRFEVRTLRRSYDNGQQIQLQSGEGRSTGQNAMHEAITSTDLEAEVEILREANAVMQDTLTKVHQEHGQLSEYIEKLEGIGRNVERHLQASQTGEATPRVPDVGRGHTW